MKISDIRFTQVNVPFCEPEIWSGGERHGVTSTLVEVETDEGLVGVGEAVPSPSPEITLAVLTEMRRQMLGENPFQIERIVNLLLSRGGFYPFPYTGNCAIGGLEMALWDIIGKACNQPVFNLLGGPVRESVSFMFFVQRKSLAEIAADARRAVEAGFRTIYTKVGLDYHSDVETVRVLRKAIGPKARLRVDANEAWSPGTAVRILQAMAPYDLEYIEQPIPMRDIDNLKALRSRTTVPIAANQASWTNRDLYRVLAIGAVDIVMTDPHQAGGLLNFRKAAGIAEAAGVPIVFHSFGPLAVTTFAAMHVIASSPGFLLDNQTYNHMMVNDIIEDFPAFRNGCLPLPTGPGLGVRLNRDRVAEYAECYEREGYQSAYNSEGASFTREKKQEDALLWFPNQ